MLLIPYPIGIGNAKFETEPPIMLHFPISVLSAVIVDIEIGGHKISGRYAGRQSQCGAWLRRALLIRNASMIIIRGIQA